jgi:hypothetical protein
MKKNNKLPEQQESPPGMNSMVAAVVEEQGEAMGNGMEEPKATDAAAFGACVRASFDFALMF